MKARIIRTKLDRLGNIITNVDKESIGKKMREIVNNNARLTKVQKKNIRPPYRNRK